MMYEKDSLHFEFYYFKNGEKEFWVMYLFDVIS